MVQDPRPTPELAPDEAAVGIDAGTDEFDFEPLWRVRLRLAWEGFKRNWALFSENKVGIIGLIIIGIFFVMAIGHPILMATLWSDKQNIYDPEIGYDAPVKTLLVVEEVTDPETQIDPERAKLFDASLKAEVGDTVNVPQQPAPPSLAHPLGTNPRGNDVLSQLMFSTKAAFMLGLVAALVTVLLATTIGSVAAYFGGITDTLLMRLADLVLLMPLIPILIVLSGMFQVNLVILGLIIGVLNGFGGTAIILKSQALSVKVKPFVEAARVAGGTNWHIIFRHIIPNVLPLSFLYMMFTVTEAIALEATLSFFGLLNVDMSWGLMIQIAQSEGYLLRFDTWWLIVPPGLAVTFLAAAFFLVGRAMDEVVNPRLRAR
ncbi:MAG: ABC transporter permease subunit [Actinobacteria bacterium]|nr:ABC transporter permease subunit [Actinomycetota bacterium]